MPTVSSDEEEEDYLSVDLMIIVDALSELSGGCRPSSKLSLGLIRRRKFRKDLTKDSSPLMFSVGSSPCERTSTRSNFSQKISNDENDGNRDDASSFV